jgi:hypothetical protein
MATGSSVVSGRYRLEWNETVLEVAARRAGLRTEIVLYRDGEAVAEGRGIGRVMLPMPADSSATSADDPDAPEPGPDVPKPPTVLAVAINPGTIARAFLLVPRPDEGKGTREEGAAQDGDGEVEAAEKDAGAEEAGEGAARAERPGEGLDEASAELPKELAELVGFARAERHLFEPPPGTFAARLLAFQREHPKLYASRHVVLATGRVVFGLLGVAVFFQLILSRVVEWIVERLSGVNWPRIPWPNIDLPSIPWPDIPLPDLPDVTLPGWLRAVLSTAKYWIPILIAIGLAVQEVKKRRSRSAAPSQSLTGDAGPAEAADRVGNEARSAGEVTRHAGGTAGGQVPGGTGQDGVSTRRTGNDRQPDAHR